MRLETERLILRDFTLDDGDALAACRMDDRYWRHYNRVPDIAAGAREHVAMFVRRQSEQPRTNFQLAILLKAGSTLIGDAGIRKQSQVSYGDGAEQEADIGYELDPRYWGHGYATEAVGALVDYGFREMALHRIWAYCLVENEPSWRLMERLGMQREGVLRRNTLLRGHWVDTFLYGLLAEEWNSTPES